MDISIGKRKKEEKKGVKIQNKKHIGASLLRIELHVSEY